MVFLKRLRLNRSVICALSVVFGFVYFQSSGYAAWQAADEEVSANAETTVSLKYAAAGSASTINKTGYLWLDAPDAPDVLMPERVAYKDGVAAVPLFVRGEGNPTLSIYDEARKTTSVVVLSSNASKGADNWVPTLGIEGEEGKAVLNVNGWTTLTLKLVSGSGAMPPTSHVSVVDHRGKTISAQFYNTFELVAGQARLKIPAAGDYNIILKLLREPVTSMPKALIREPQSIPFGRTIADIKQPGHCPDGITTQVVMGTRVALEHIPTTATIVGIDRLRAVAIARHSILIQKNNWPFAISGADILSMSIGEQKKNGPELLRWERLLGSSFTPVTLKWADVQKSKGSLYWANVNTAFDLYRRGMVRPLLTIVGRASWNHELPTHSPETLDAWKRFVRLVSEMHHKRIWGLLCWKYPEETWSNPTDYLKLLDATLNGFQLRNGKKIPVPAVVTGAMRRFDRNYLSALLTSATTNRLNAIGFDLYPADKKASPEKNGLLKTLVEARELLQKQGGEKVHLWITGSGWPVGSDGVTSKLQANYMVRTHVMALSQGVYKIVWDTLRNTSNSLWDADPKNRMGLLDENFFPNISGAAYNIMSYMLSGCTPVDMTRQGKAMIYKFNIALQNNKWPGTLYVAWTESTDQTQDVGLEMTHGGGVYALDYLGAEIQPINVSKDSEKDIVGTYQFRVGYEPVFIWDAGKRG